MRFLKRSPREHPKLSLILLDWSVRESFHLLHYLRQQSVERDRFEVVFIEYYSRVAEALKPFADQVDTWLLLEMAESCVYHKHLMYNCGLVFANGEIVVLCDSDAMVKDDFIATIIAEFFEQGRIVLHLDQFRNVRRDFYPFNYPSFDEVLGEGCINNADGKTSGIRDPIDPLHSRNYGACMCARREDLIAIGGADEHIDYLGHVCGPYEITFRLANGGFKEIWHETEFLYHTWHPGQAGVDNYQGPHDGRQMSSTALEAFVTKRVQPLAENRAIRLMRAGERLAETGIEDLLIDERYPSEWDRSRLEIAETDRGVASGNRCTDLHRGFKIMNDGGRFYAWGLLDAQFREPGSGADPLILEGKSVQELVEKIDVSYPLFLRLNEKINSYYSSFSIMTWAIAAPLIGIARAVRNRFGRSRASVRLVATAGFRENAFFPGLQRLWQQYRVGWLAVRQYRGYMDRWANHLIANLYFANRQALPRHFRAPPVVLTTSLFVQIYLRSLMIAGIIPRARITRLRNSAKIRQYFDRLSRDGEHQSLIVARNIYTGYYGLIQACPNLKEPLLL
jgi:hypothetical protein